MYSEKSLKQPAAQPENWTDIGELVRVVVMRIDGVRPKGGRMPVPTSENTFIGRCRFVRADGGPHWRPAHFDLRQDAYNAPASLCSPLFDPYLVEWRGAWQIFAGWEIAYIDGRTHERRQLWAITRDLGE